MKSLLASIALVTALLLPSSGLALTPPEYGAKYFVGSTEQLFKIRAALAKAAGYESDAWVFPSSYTWAHTLIAGPWQMGDVDCMDSAYHADGGPFSGAADYLGMSVDLGSEVVEIPSLEDLKQVSDPGFPAQCYGYLFAMECADPIFGWLVCMDPVP